MDERLPEEGRIAGVDYGTVRIGVAISDPGRTLASPCENYTRGNEQQDQQFFRQFVEREEVVGFVVGLPVHQSGDESQKSLEARQFGRWLGEHCGLPVVFFDERYTSKQAQQILVASGVSKKQRQRHKDMLAAQILLAAFLESDRLDRRPDSLG